MKYGKLKIVLLATAGFAIGALAVEQTAEFKLKGNPIYENIFTADPAVMVDGDTLYVYAGQDEAAPGGWFNMNNWVCFSTKNMVDWKYEGVVLKCTDFAWGSRGTAWACHVVKKKDKYYFYSTSGQPNGKGLTVGVAVSDSPTGPFRDVKGEPLFDNTITTGNKQDSMEDIDPAVFIDDDGQGYIYWGNGKLHYALLSDDMLSLKDLDGDGKLTEGVDVFTDVKINNMKGSYAEAPWLYKESKKYYLVYASELPQYVRYAVSDSPRGPWEYAGTILDRNLCPDGKAGPDNSDTCHPAVVRFKEHSYVFYHNSALPTGGQTRRSVCVEEMFYNPDGTIKPVRKTSIGLAGKAKAVRIQSAKDQDQYLTSSGFDVAFGVEPDGAEGCIWEISDGLIEDSDADMVSIQSVTHPGYYLVVNDDKVVLAKHDGGEAFKKRATFRMVPGLAGSGQVSFQLAEDAQRYLRQNTSNGIVEIVADSSGGLSSAEKQTASFSVVSGK